MVISRRGDIQGYKLSGSTGHAFWIGDESGVAEAPRSALPVSNSGFAEPNLIWLLPARDVPCGIRDIPGTILRDSMSSPNVVRAGAAASSSVCGLMTAGTFNSDGLYLWSCSLKPFAASSHHSCVNSSGCICIFRNISLRCYTVLEIVPISQPGLSSSLSLPCSVSWWSSSSPSSPSLKLAISLRLSPIATIIPWNIVLWSVVANPVFSAVSVSFCSSLIALLASSNRFLATVVSLSTSSSIQFSLLHCITCAFHIVSLLQAAFWIASCAMPHRLGPILLPSCSCLHLLDDIVVWTAWSICHICRREVAKCSFSEHSPLLCVLTMLLGEMLDVARHGHCGGNLRLLCQGWYI